MQLRTDHVCHLSRKRLKSLIFVGVLGLLCSCHRLSMREPVRENEYVRAVEQNVLNAKGAPQQTYQGYRAIPPWHRVNPNAVKTSYYRTGEGHLYLYYDQFGVVVESLYFDDSVRF